MTSVRERSVHFSTTVHGGIWRFVDKSMATLARELSPRGQSVPTRDAERFEGGARLRGKGCACCATRPRASVSSVYWHSPDHGEFHLYANSKPRDGPCFHLEIPTKRVAPPFCLDTASTGPLSPVHGHEQVLSDN